MRRFVKWIVAAAGVAMAADAGLSVPTPERAAPPRLLPTGDGIDRSALDMGTDPCTNFYRHACGGFIASHPATAEHPLIALADLQANSDFDRSLTRLLGEPARGDRELERLQRFYQSCRQGTAGDEALLRRWLIRIESAKSRSDIRALTRDLAAIGVDAFVNYGGRPDRNRLDRNRGEIHPGALWAQPEAVAAVFRTSGRPDAVAAREAAAVADLTQRLVKQRNERWDAAKAENPRTIAQLQAMDPAFDWPAYLRAAGARPGKAINVTSPAYLRALDKEFRSRPLPELRAYLRWAFLFSLRGELPRSYDAALAQLPLNWRPQLADQDRRCRDAAVRAMGVEFSRQYSGRVLGVPARDAARRLSETIRAEIIRSIGEANWLSPRARAATADKLRHTDLKIGFPDLWPATGQYPVSREHFLANVLASRRFEQQREWARAAQPRRRTAWEMKVSPWVGEGMAAARLVIPNGFPDAFSNSLIMTAAFLSAPRFDASAHDELNYATYGSVFAHEFVHVAQLHMFGPAGEDAELWEPQDDKAADARGQCVIDQANAYQVAPGLHLAGADEFPENVADYGGLRLAYEALKRSLGDKVERRDALNSSPAQRFFYRYAQSHCTSQTDASLRDAIANDGHAPASFRVNGPLSNMPEFRRAFNCPAQAPMARPAAQQCRVW
jgi:endothelin-converting enzyme/putative endopeptidase